MSLYLGIDAGTQSIKAELIDAESGRIVESCAVNFGAELPQYGAPNGFCPHPDPTVRQADPLMWLDALDRVLEKLRDSGAPLDRIAGISGSGQQHGSVCLNAEFPRLLAALDPARPLAGQLAPALSRPLAPIWMDRSTHAECEELDARFGERLRLDTGSPAIERFTGPQLRKFAKEQPAAYAATASVHLVSSFLASVLAGKPSPIDYGDGAGMNLLNLKSLQWDAEIAEFTAPGLAGKLPAAAPSDTVAGGLSPYFEKYGLRAGTPVAVFSGDNPNSLVGTGATEPGVAVISLGTSDTFFAAMADFRTDPAGCGHVFGNPAGGFMSLICFANGSLAREQVKEECGADWNFFDRTACETTLPGNHGKLMLPYFEPENTPLVLTPGVKYNFNPNDATPAERIRAVLESQALSMRLHSRWQQANFKRIRVTGGASKSPAFRQILADVFEAPIESIRVANSAALGAALRAANAVGGIPFPELYRKFCAATETVAPIPANARIYAGRLPVFRQFEAASRR